MVQTRIRPTRESRSDKRREILDAAARVFRRQGLPATGMRDIAAELDMAVGNLYYYFRDKGELLAYCQDDALNRLLALAAEARRRPGPADERLRYLIVGHARCLHEETPGSVAHLEVEALAEADRPELVARRDRYEACIRGLVEDGVTEGLFVAVDPKLATQAILGALNWTAKWFDPAGPLTAEEIGSSFADLLIGGLRARAGSGPAPADPSPTRPTANESST